MKIRKLHIKNYKVFDDIELDFTDANGKTLDKIVLAGVNGCGKTTVLEIIKKFYNDTINDEYSKSHGSFIEAEIELFKEDKKSFKSTIDYLTDEKTITILKSNERQLIFTVSLINQSYNIFFNLIKELIDQLIYLPVTPSGHNTSFLKLNDKIIKLLHISTDKGEMKKLALKDLRDEVFKNEDITIREGKEKAIKRLQKPLNSLELTTKLVDLESEELIFESPNGEKIKFEDLSSGEQNLYFRAIYLSVLNPQNSIIMIDQPEDSLHPTWQQKVMQLYQNIGENNQVIVATHSPHIIGSSKAEEVFLLQIDENQIEARHPKYTKGHSIDYVLDEIMGANSRDTSVINLVDSYLALMRKGLHESEEGLKIKASIDLLKLDPNSEEMLRLDLSMKRIKAIGV